MEQILQNQAAAARPGRTPGADLSPSLLEKLHNYCREPSAPQKDIEHILLSSAPSLQQGSNLAPKHLSDLWEVLILILHSPSFQAFAPLFSWWRLHELHRSLVAHTEIACASCPCVLWWDIRMLAGTLGSCFWFEHLWVAITGIVWRFLRWFWLSGAARQPWQTVPTPKLCPDFRKLLTSHRAKPPSLIQKGSLWTWRAGISSPASLIQVLCSEQ